MADEKDAALKLRYSDILNEDGLEVQLETLKLLKQIEQNTRK